MSEQPRWFQSSITVRGVAWAVLPCLALCLSASALQGQLPEVEFEETGPQTYRLVCEYHQTDADELFLGKQRIEATYVRGLPAGRVEWSHASIARVENLADEFPAAGEALDYMSGFSYDSRRSYLMFFPAFFADFPGSTEAAYAKNLVWDTHMLEQFARSYFSQLRLNERLVLQDISDSSVPLAGMGAFKNRRIELTWVGLSERNGEECALIRYEAFFNRFDMRMPETGIDGLSHYWGLIWVSLVDKQLEHATLNEHVSLRMHGKESKVSRFRVLRVASLTKVASGK